MTDSREVLREVSWRDLCPWLIIFRTFGLATSFPLLLLATAGALLTPVGWRVAETLFIAEQDVREDDDFQQTLQENARWPGAAASLPAPSQGHYPRSVRDILLSKPDTIHAVFWSFVHPAGALFRQDLSVTKAAYYVFGVLWLLIVWGFCGGVITRMAAMRLGREERIGLGDAVRFARRRLASYVASPVFPLGGLLLTSLPMLVCGLLLRWEWGVLVAGILWGFLLLSGVFSAILVLGLLFGWPLMWGTISCERQGDVFEAFSRSYSYCFRRPLHYLFYALLATAFGALGWLLVYHFANGVLYLTDWPAALVAGTERWSEIERLRDDPASAAGTLRSAGALLDFFRAGVRAVASGFSHSFFWCLATAIYLLLRRDVDRTEFDEVYVEDESRGYQLPSLEPATASGNAAAREPARAPAAGSEEPRSEPPAATPPVVEQRPPANDANGPE